MSLIKVTSSLTFRSLRCCQVNVRWFSSRDDPGESENQIVTDQYIPERIKKRLKSRGLTEDNLVISHESKDAHSTSSKLDLQKALNDSVVEKNINDIEFPSDLANLGPKNVTEQKKPSSVKPPSIDPSLTSVLLFPGQGSQFIGMGKKLLAYPGVEELYNKASNILGYDLLNICINGPIEKLNKTIYCQPAVVVTSLAAMERLKEEHPQAVERCVGAAGFSVGEYSALVASGVLSFEDAMYLIKLRAQAMQAMSERVDGGMMTVVCDHRSKLRIAMVAAREYCAQKLNISEPECQVANYLCSNTKVIAGHTQALDFIEKYGKEWHLYKMKRLPVSGAFHTDLMHDKSKEFYQFVNAMKNVTINQPKFPVYANLDGEDYKSNDVRFRRQVELYLRKQIYRPVKWEQIMLTLFKRPPELDCPHSYEVGPGRQLGYLLRKTHAKAFTNYHNIEV